MAAGISIAVKGLNSTKLFLKKKEMNVAGSTKRALNLAGIHVQGEVKLSIAGKRAEFKSVDTGRFLNSVDVQSNKDSATIFSKLPYAYKLEYGTNFKNSPRKHFRNTLNREKPRVKQIIQNELKKI